jgi:hypothetical protein
MEPFHVCEVSQRILQDFILLTRESESGFMSGMIIADREGLGAVQIARINRFELARWTKKNRSNRDANMPMIALLVGIALILCSVMVVLISHRWSPGTELYTRLSRNLDEQTPSITIYAR